MSMAYGNTRISDKHSVLKRRDLSVMKTNKPLITNKKTFFIEKYWNDVIWQEKDFDAFWQTYLTDGLGNQTW